MMRGLGCVGSLCAALLVHSVASAQGAPGSEDDGAPRAADTPKREPLVPFGKRGQWALLASSTSLGASNEAFSGSDANFFHVGGELGFDYFAANGFSIGADVGANHSQNRAYNATSLIETTSNSFSIGARAGVNVPLSRSLSWYPRLTFGLQWAHTETNNIQSFLGVPSADAAESSVGPWLNLFLPLVFQPAPHFLIGLGPRVQHSFATERGGPYDGAQSTLLGGELVIGGFWGGPAPSDETKAESSAPRTAAFGTQGDWVLTFGTNASFSHNSLSKTNASSTNVGLEPSFDYFAIPGVSVGLDLYFTHSSGRTLLSGGGTDFDTTTKGFGPRFGVDIPLRDQLSLWPRVELGYGTRDSTLTSGSAQNLSSLEIVWLQVSLPLVAVVTSHFFVGGGPSLYHELSDTDQFNRENDGTSLGANALLGGWI